MIQENQHISDETLSQTIRQSFFLTDSTVINQQMLDAFKSGMASGNLYHFSKTIRAHHTDTFSIHITHDIDWLNPFHPYSIANGFRSLVTKHQWLSFKQLMRQDIFLRNIEQLLSLEKALNINAIYCLGANNVNKWGRYDIRYNTKSSLFAELISVLQSHQQTIALHSSVNANQPKQLQKEIATLGLHTHQPVTLHRSHYLTHSTPRFYEILSQNNIHYDIGAGAAKQVGFRHFFPGKNRPINPNSLTPINVTLIPLMLLDNIFFKKPYYEAMKAFRQTLEQLKEYNGSACILFHPENMLLKPQLYSYFEEIIHICKQEGAQINPSLT